MLGAAFGIGFVFGPALGGLLGSVDPRLPFWVAAALSLCNAAYGFFVLPESLPLERRSAFSWRKAKPIGSLKMLRSHKNLIGISVMNFFNQLSHVVLPSTFVLYVSYRYKWDERTVGMTLAGVGLCSMIVQATLVQPFVKRFGERNTLLIGMFFGNASFVVYGLAPTGRIFWIGVPPMAFWGLANPAIQGLMAARVGPSEQGQLQGANGSIMGIAELIGPLLFTLTFSYFISADRSVQIPGSPFLLAAAILVCATLVAFRVAKPEK